MLKRHIRVCFLLIGLSHSSTSSAHKTESGTFSYAAGLSFTQVNTGLSFNSEEDSFQPGFIIKTLADMSDKSSIEIDLNYVRLKYFRKDRDQVIIDKAQRFLIHYGYRHWFTTDFSLGLLLFSNYAIGSTERIYTSETASPDMTTSASENADDGFSFSLQYDWRLKDNKGFVIDFRMLKYFGLPDGEIDENYHFIFAYKTSLPKTL